MLFSKNTVKKMRESFDYDEVEKFMIERHRDDSEWEPPTGDEFYHCSSMRHISPEARYYVAFGPRSKGKTTDGLMYAIARYVLYGEKLAYVRRWADDIRSSKTKELFAFLTTSHFINDITDGEYNQLIKYGDYFYMSKYDPETCNRITAQEPMAYMFAINTWERDKGLSFPKIDTLVFDEFITSTTYLEDEFVNFENIISTIVRQRDTMRIYMFGNTISKYNPYFREMGLVNAKNMKEGDIEVYKYYCESLDNYLEVAVEFTDGKNEKKVVPSDIYFAFNNPKLKMITSGVWEIDSYPHLPMKFSNEDVRYKYYIEFDDEKFLCRVIKKGKSLFTYITEKTSEFSEKDEDRVVIFSQKYDARPNWRRSICNTYDDFGKMVWKQFQMEKVFYQDNMVGDTIYHYLNWSKENKGGI